jgi:hypothetical protein
MRYGAVSIGSGDTESPGSHGEVPPLPARSFRAGLTVRDHATEEHAR